MIFSFDIQTYTYFSGNKEKSDFVWKLPSDLSLRDISKTVATCERVSQNIKQYHSRAMMKLGKRKLFLAKPFAPNTETLTLMYKLMTGDESRESLKRTDLILDAINCGDEDSLNNLPILLRNSHKD